MENLGWIVITLVIALIGGISGHMLRLPAGAMLGAMLSVVALNLVAEKGYFYSDLRVAVQILSGAMIGSRIGKKDLSELRQIVLPMIILLGSMVILNLSFGMAMYKFSSLDTATALFASAPGGVADMALISEDLGANTVYVAISQLFRVFVVLSCLPPLFKRIVISYRKKHGIVIEPAARAAPEKSAGENRFLLKDMQGLLILLVIGVIGGLFLRWLNITAGALIGSMVVCAAYCVIRGKVRFPVKLRVVMQSVTGAYIGVQFSRQTIALMGELIVPLAIMFAGIFVFAFGVGFIMYKATGLDIAICLLASAPGGVAEMALLSEDLGSDTPKIAIMQTVRLFTVILIFPSMLRLITTLV